MPFFFIIKKTKNLTQPIYSVVYTFLGVCVPHKFWQNLHTLTVQRSEHIPVVRFCKYLLVNLLTDRYVCFNYFTFSYCCPSGVLCPFPAILERLLQFQCQSWTVYQVSFAYPHPYPVNPVQFGYLVMRCCQD